MTPKVSIILANYNEEKYIAEAIESVINQTYTNWELIIIDDASTDRSQDIINSYKPDFVKRTTMLHMLQILVLIWQ